jgi:hypothetical protein
VWYEGETPAQIQINHVDLSFTASTLLVQAQANDEMLLHVIDGALDLQSNGRAFGVNSGDAAAITLGGEDGLTPINSPLLSHAYSFAAIRGAPLELISSVSDSDQENAVCIAGVEDYVRTLAQPSEDAREMLNLDPNLHYQVTGQFSEGETRWFQLDGDSNPSWVQQDSVDTVGACAGIAEIEWNPPVAASSSSSASSSSGSAGDGAANSSSGVPFVPTGQSVWSATSGQEFSTGTCNFPPLAMCQHLVAITLNDDGTISWRGQEPTAYQLYSSGNNFYSFEGRNKLGNANISMGLSFQGESGWTMTMTQIFDNDPQCIRTFYYSASRQW